ncbi:hypothetical protein NL676_030606 [Syzygium grande]|nr:hypothetical protein NL676_030606 [Syzygium grande]
MLLPSLKSKEQIDKPMRYKKRDMRTDCDAKIKCMVNDGTWKISKVILEQNDGLKGCFVGAHGKAEDSRATTALSTSKIVDELGQLESMLLFPMCNAVTSHEAHGRITQCLSLRILKT